MPSKVKIKKKKSLVLTPRNVETVDTDSPAESPPAAPPGKRKVVIKAGSEGIARKASAPPKENSSTLRVEEDEIEVVMEENVLDASDSMAVELNSSTVRDPVLQQPLTPENAEPSPPGPQPEDEHFKFFCYRCGQRLKVPVVWANKSIPCGRCGHDLVIPPPLVDPV